ncbi:DUF2887 domain-containing protein [Methylicorpusculum sp.]|uniref:DUF2887 domain-containing protein n=1 Tax=Methylicorpusculum sp. TaxID=2713644 RepID=UPI00351F2F41
MLFDNRTLYLKDENRQSPFYRLFKNAPKLVLLIADLNYDESEKYDFRSEEIKKATFRFDGIITPASAQFLLKQLTALNNLTSSNLKVWPTIYSK